MQKFTDVRSNAESVQPMETDEYHVIINNGITEIHEEATGEEETGFNGWEIAEQLIYDKDEYIALISQENAEIGETVNSILTEIIPSLLS